MRCRCSRIGKVHAIVSLRIFFIIIHFYYYYHYYFPIRRYTRCLVAQTTSAAVNYNYFFPHVLALARRLYRNTPSLLTDDVPRQSNFYLIIIIFIFFFQRLYTTLHFLCKVKLFVIIARARARSQCPKLDRLNGQANKDGESRFSETIQYNI